MTASPVASGAGFRQARMYLLDDEGIIDGTQTGSDGYAGRKIEGAKTFQATTPDAQVIRHTGDDNVFAVDSLPPTELETATLTTGKSNFSVDAELSGTKVYTLGELKIMSRGTNKQGFEPSVALMVWRQALDTAEGSATYGKRQYFTTIYGKSRIIPKGGGMAEQQADENSYNVVPTPVEAYPWGADVSETNEGATRVLRFDVQSDNPLIMERYDAPGAVANFLTDFTPITAAKCQAWVDKVIATVLSVSTAGKYITLSSAPTLGQKVVILYEASDLT